jgi:hypothetical protein
MRRFATSTILLAAAAVAAPAQMVVSAHSGTVHYSEGAVSIDGAPVKSQPGHFDQMKEQSVLRTTQGRAEILLTPGVFLRVGANSEVKLLDNRLESTRVELLSGSATLETDTALEGDKYKHAPVTIIFKSYEVQPMKDGLLEITSDPAQVLVYKGDASVRGGDNRVTVKDGHEVFLTAALATQKFEEKSSADDNYLWARDRSAEISAANLSSARTIANNSGFGYSGFGLGYGGYGSMSPYLSWASNLWGASMYGGGWYYNPLLGMFTYLPVNGYAFSPFGYGFYSPVIINSVYVPTGRTWYGAGGARTGAVIGRPIGGSGAINRGPAINSSALFRSGGSSANVISTRMAGAAMGRNTGGFSGRPMGGPAMIGRPMEGGVSAAPAAIGGGGMRGGGAAPMGGGGGGMRGGGGGAPAGRGR